MSRLDCTCNHTNLDFITQEVWYLQHGTSTLSPVPQTAIRASWLFANGGRGTVWTHSLLVMKHPLINSGSMQAAILLAACSLCRNSAIGTIAPVKAHAENTRELMGFIWRF